MTKRKQARRKKASRRSALREWGLFVEYKQNKKGTRKHTTSFDLIVTAPASATHADLLRLAARELPKDEKWRAKLLKPAWVTFSKGEAKKAKRKVKVRSAHKPKPKRKKRK